MYKTILVPLDGSNRAEAILPHINLLARLYKADVVLLQVFELPHVINLPKVGDDDYDALPHLKVEDLQAETKFARHYLRGQIKKLAEAGVAARERIEFGPVAATIIRIAELEDVDLIAMASHGCSGLQGVYYGSVAAGVLQRVDRPLLIVRSENQQ